MAPATGIASLAKGFGRLLFVAVLVAFSVSVGWELGLAVGGGGFVPIGAFLGAVIGLWLAVGTLKRRQSAPEDASQPDGNPCPECGETDAASANFCRNCGAELDRENPDEVASVRSSGSLRYCSMCGAEVDEGADACPGCGRPFR